MTEKDPRGHIVSELEIYKEAHPEEGAVLERFLAFVRSREDAMLRSCAEGHVTGSAFIVDPGLKRLLLVHHRKLGLWVQPGGHCEAGEEAYEAALREAYEETGTRPRPWRDSSIFDIDIHAIPALARSPAHLHYDLRFLFVAEEGPVRLSEESRAVEWMDFAEARRRNPEASILRPLAKIVGLRS